MARRRSRRRSGENLVTPGTETAPGILDEAADEMQEAVDGEYEDADAYDHNGVGYEEGGDGGGDAAVPAGLNQPNGAHGTPVTPNLDGTRRNIEGPATEGGNRGPNTGGGGNNGPPPGGGTIVNVDDDTDESAFLPNGTPYSTKFYDKLISFGVLTSQVRTLMQNGITSPNEFAVYFDRTALDELLSDKDNGLKVMPKIVQQKLRGLHRWLRTQHREEVNLSQPDILDLFNDKEMATALSEEGKGGAMRERAGAHGTKDPQVSYPTFKGDQASWKNWDNKWRAFL